MEENISVLPHEKQNLTIAADLIPLPVYLCKQMKHYSNDEIIDGIATNKSKVLIYIYKVYYPLVENFVYQHGGTNDQAQDLFQEGMIIIYNKIKKGKLKLICKFSTYLYAVCKLHWMQEKRKDMQRMNMLKEAPIAAEPTIAYGEETVDAAKQLFDKHFKQLSPDCQTILNLYFNKCTIDEIRTAMNYNTAHHAVDRKYRCKKNLIDRIMKDPLFRKIVK